MRRSPSVSRSHPVHFRLNPEDLELAARVEPTKLTFERLQGRVVMDAKWNKDSKRSSQVVKNDRLILENVVIVAVVDELMEASRHVAEKEGAESRVILHGTPFELGVARRGEAVDLAIVEVVDYAGPEMTVGRVRMSMGKFLDMVSYLALGFVGALQRANPAFGHHPGLTDLKREALRLRSRAK